MVVIGLGFDDLSAVDERVIMVRVSGYGLDVAPELSHTPGRSRWTGASDGQHHDEVRAWLGAVDHPEGPDNAAAEG